jgi:hypothetical protein
VVVLGGRPHRWEPPTGFAVAEEHLGQGVAVEASLSTSSVVPTTTTATSASAASATARSSSSSSEACLARLSWKVTTATSASPNPPVSLGW